MTTPSVLANIEIGVLPPQNPSSNTRWISQSAKHYQLPHGTYARVPIAGSFLGQTGVSEMSPWFNTTLNRYEALVNRGNYQYFIYANTPIGHWSTPVLALGNGTGGEASFVVEATVYQEGGSYYLLYLKAPAATVITMATMTPPTTVAGLPTFSVNGTIYNPGWSGLESPWLVKANGQYYLFASHTEAQLLATTTASSPASFVGTPFTTAANLLTTIYTTFGARVSAAGFLGRNQVFYENGLWILYGHLLPGGFITEVAIYRFTCTDAGLPLNWVQDTEQRFLQQAHPGECDQVSDFRVLNGPNSRNWAFWTGVDNNLATHKNTIFCAPVLEPMMAFDGNTWNYSGNYVPCPAVLQEGNFVNPDYLNVNHTVINMDDAWFDTKAASYTATLPSPACYSRFKITNSPSDAHYTFFVHLTPNAVTDVIMSGNPVTSVTTTGTVVTVNTLHPHNLSTSDFVTLTGMTPTGFSVNGTAVTTIPTANSFTVAITLAGPITIIGCYDSSLVAGETRHYRCRKGGIWVRD